MRLVNVLSILDTISDIPKDIQNSEDLLHVLEGFNTKTSKSVKQMLLELAEDNNTQDITNVLTQLEPIGITPKTNGDVYKTLELLLKSEGKDRHLLNALTNFFPHRNEIGLTLEELDEGNPISILEIAKQKLGDTTGEAVNLLANITGQHSSIARGKLEVLLGIISKGGHLEARNLTDAGKGDIIIDGKAIEIKCSSTDKENPSISHLKTRGGKLGSKGEAGLKDVNSVLDGLYEIFNTYYNALKIPDRITALPSRNKHDKSKSALNLAYYSKGFIDRYLLKNIPLNTDVDLIKHTYKQIFLNFFTGDALKKVTPWIESGLDYFMSNRTLKDMITEQTVVGNRLELQEFMGCVYLKHYYQTEGFKGIIISSLLNSSHDKSIFLSEKTLSLEPMEMAKKLHGTGITFSWQRLDASASRSVIMSVFVA